MNPGLKQRLIGGVVLVVLAVIFLPMLLPGKSDSSTSISDSGDPAATQRSFTPIEIPLELPPAAPPQESAVAAQPQPGDTENHAPPQQVPAPTAALPPPLVPAGAASVPTSTSPPPVAAARLVIAPPPKGSDAGSGQVSAKASDGGWAVQLGSFSSSTNATALQEKARKAGFRAYVERVKSGGATSYRVRIGPESSRDRADITRGKVEAKLKMKALVVPHKA